MGESTVMVVGYWRAEETGARLSLSVSNARSKGGRRLSSPPRRDKRSNINAGTKAGADCIRWRGNARNCTLSTARKGCPWGGGGRDVFIMRQNLLFLLFLVWGPVSGVYCNLHHRRRGWETRGLEIGGGDDMFWRRGDSGKSVDTYPPCG